MVHREVGYPALADRPTYFPAKARTGMCPSSLAIAHSIHPPHWQPSPGRIADPATGEIIIIS